MAGPLAVVLASLASAWLAVKSDDGVVAADYYKRGLDTSLKLPLTAVDPAHRLGATITVRAKGEVRARLEGLVDPPKELRLELGWSGSPREHEIVILKLV